ncbi:DNA methyltransferase [Tistrella sp. BH-R2-4]|uniref:site-specific DNA-methyltransferase (adenine-specific) n=1 Tax=Tistrella arctica TaxID=3133430 RepID=A0ABU9YRF8_9PROT
MNAVEIEEAVSELVGAPFDATEFPFAFLQAFGMKETTIKRLRKGDSNASDVAGGVLQRNNIHIATCAVGAVDATFQALRHSPKTISARAKFILATDGQTVAAEDLISGETIAPDYPKLAEHFAFFLPLAGISTVKEIRNNPVDVKATGRLNKLYLELLKDNPDWALDARRPALNQLMARLIFCFFAEDTGIFLPQLFTRTIEQMSDSRSGNTHEVLAELFRAMDTPPAQRAAGRFRPWADQFPYVNGGLFTDATDVPRFSRLARSYLLRAGELNWQEINPDIFGSMIQAVADDAERGALGMHYTSVPNILKVLNPLFLDDLRDQLAAAADNTRKLRNLRRRLARIRVFDPACGSGNFLVIAYKEMRAIEHQIIRRTGDAPKSVIRLENFFGIEIKNFAVEIARLALLIAEFQADCVYISQHEARAMVLPLHRTGQIHAGNALRMNWLEVCPPPAKTLVVEQDLAGPTGRLALEDNGLADSGEVETYICGNPPYLGSTWQSAEQKADIELIFGKISNLWKSLDYVCGWLFKSAQYGANSTSRAALVATNSICQGQQVSILWPLINNYDQKIIFAYTSFKWANLASQNAGVTVIIIGISGPNYRGKKKIFYTSETGEPASKEAENINPYLYPGPDIIVKPKFIPQGTLHSMEWGNKPTDGGHLILSSMEKNRFLEHHSHATKFVRRYVGSQELIKGTLRWCLWITDENRDEALSYSLISDRVRRVMDYRANSSSADTRPTAAFPHRFRQIQNTAGEFQILVSGVSSESRDYLPCDLFSRNTIASNKVFCLYDAPLWNMSLVASRLHLVWIATVCVRMRTDFSYSNTLGWNTFPVPKLTEQNKADLTRCAENILLVREGHFPATIAELYDPEKMPDDLRRAHDENDEVLERIYIGRRFRNDTERLEKLFDLYTKMTADTPRPTKKTKGSSAA